MLRVGVDEVKEVACILSAHAGDTTDRGCPPVDFAPNCRDVREFARIGTRFTYKAMYKFVDGGVHAEILDFPGVVTCAGDLEEARRLLGSALVDMAETNLLHGEPLPRPNPTATNSEPDLEEPIHLPKS